jgi:outer membrane protein OmpA-like peptidoglycan-associated protein
MTARGHQFHRTGLGITILALILFSAFDEAISVEIGSARAGQIPVGEQALAFQGGYILPHEQVLGTVLGGRELRTYFGNGDLLYIRFKRDIDTRIGDWVTVYRLTTPVTHPVTNAYMGRLIEVRGILEIVSAPRDQVVEARVVQPFESIASGDPVMLYTAPIEIPDQGVSHDTVTGVIVEFKVPRQVTAQGEIVYIDLGAQDGIALGDRFNVIRRGPRESLNTNLPDYVLGELKVIGVQQRTATTKVVKSLDAVKRGDYISRIPVQTAGLTEERVTDPLAVLPDAEAEDSAARKAREARRQLKPIYFAFDRWDVSERELSEAVEFLKENPTAGLLIEGHADERGSREYNFVLAEKRARAIHRHLEAHGFTNPINVTSYGKEKPVCLENDDPCHSRNRRAQLVIDTD